MSLSVADIAARIARVHPLSVDLDVMPIRRGDHVLNPALAPGGGRARPKDAAVLIGLIEQGGSTQVIFTRRTAGLRSHSGEIALPGGKIDPEDGHAVDAALREAEEEIGLDPMLVRPLGLLDPYVSHSGYRIFPVVAEVSPRVERYHPNPAEVDEVFQVPLAFLADEANHQLGSRPWQGIERFYWTMPYGRYFIWGVTAGILRVFYEQLVKESL